jgi:hypothetical protein
VFFHFGVPLLLLLTSVLSLKSGIAVLIALQLVIGVGAVTDGITDCWGGRYGEGLRLPLLSFLLVATTSALCSEEGVEFVIHALHVLGVRQKQLAERRELGVEWRRILLKIRALLYDRCGRLTFFAALLFEIRWRGVGELFFVVVFFFFFSFVLRRTPV